MESLPQVLSLIIIFAALGVGILLCILRKKEAGGSASIFAFSICLLLAAILYLSSEQTILHNLTILTILNTFSYIAAFFLAVIVFIFGLEFRSHRSWISFPILALLSFFPILTLLFIHTGISSFALSTETTKTSTIYISAQGAWGWLNLVYSIGILTASLVLLIIPYNTLEVAPYKAPPMRLLTSSIILAILINVIGFSGLLPIPDLELVLVGYSLIGISFIIYVIQYRSEEISLISRDEIFLGLGDGVIVLNGRENIIDMNSAAEQIIGISIRDAYDKPINQIISNWGNLIHDTDAKELEFRGSVYLNHEWRYLSVRLSSMTNSMGGEIGKTIILRDITDRRTLNEDHQRARDEMFAFLRTLFNESGNTQSTGEFLRSALFQIAYTFHVQNGAVLILEFSTDVEETKYNLSAKYGPLMERDTFLSGLDKSLGAVSWVLKNKQPLIVPDVRGEPRLSDISLQFEHLSIGFFPLIANQQVLGLIMLARTEAPGFNSDETIRLNIVTEELASYLYADRQKQMNIIVAERQRLARDLHDSVTQKLYGLVTLSEAIQIGLETGSTDRTSEHVASISVYARQALREMRLFLHELQPVDLEHEGFVSILQQRLVAVEGHSDIQAQFLTGKNISIPKDKELALYFITQEALNNIIKHARAKSVLVKLSQRKQLLHLSIVDDGIGFDPGKSGRTGMGLKNMFARADQIGATLKVTSALGKGTKISLTLPI